MKTYDTKTAVTDRLKRNMAENLKKSFELLNTLMELKLSYLKKRYPDKTEAQLTGKIHRDIIEAKERQWNYLEKVIKNSDQDWSYIEQLRADIPGEITNR